MIRAGTKASGGDDWKELYRLLVTSLRASSVHFEQQLSVEALTVGLWGLSTEHSKAQAPLLSGRQIGPAAADRAAVAEWLHLADVLLSCFDAGATTPAALASSLGVQEACVLHFQPLSQPLLPAHALVADASRQQLLLLVRGTSGWADVLTDLVAHTEPLGQGQAHSGMLDCARAILQQTVPLMQRFLEQQPGCYRIHCIGHSLGGGVAALAAYLVRNDEQLRQQLQAASGVMATGFGTPPVMTQQLAEAASSWTRTLVHGSDLVPRTCVASLVVLRSELEAQKEAVYSNNATLTRLRDSGVLQAAGSFCSAAIASRVTSGVAAAAVGKSRWVSAGLVGAGLLVSKAKQLHAETLAGGANSSAQGAAAPALPPASGGNGSSTTGTFSFAAMRQAAVSAVAASATQQQPAAQPQPPADAQQQQQQQQQPPPQQQQQQQRYDEEEQAAKVHLFCPGQLWHLSPTTTGASGAEASYTLVQAPASCSDRFGSRILVQRSMLSDHFLTEHMQALLVLQAQLMEQAAAGM